MGVLKSLLINFIQFTIMLTFDKIRELERMEKQSKKLQKIPEDIVMQLRDYLKRKDSTEKTSTDIMELEKIRDAVKRFFEMRESKIVSASLDTARTGLPPENMTKDEEELFYKLVDTIKKSREKFFADLSKEDKNAYTVKKTLPAFIGPDMNRYELAEGQIVHIPAPLDELLLKEGVIEKAN